MDTQVATAIDEGLTNFTEKYDLDATIVRDLRTMLIEAAKKHVKPRAAAGVTAKSGEKRERRKTGYNLYIKTRFEESKNSQTKNDKDGNNSQTQMAAFSREWGALSDEEKRTYTEMADAINAENGANTSKKGARTGKRNLSGYNLFYRDERANIRASKEEDVNLMVAVGRAWKALSQEERDEYNKRAADESSAIVAEE